MKPLVCVLVLLTTFTSANDLWQTGAGRTNITPTEPIWMSGYASRKTPADGKTTDLWAKALVLDDAKGNRGVLITLDLVGIGRSMSQELCTLLKTRFDFERHQIAICTSHTHSGPVVGRNLGPMYAILLAESEQEKIRDYGRKLPELIASAVGEALTNLEPSRVQWGSGHSHFAVNRRENNQKEVPSLRAVGELKGPVDHDVPVLSVRNEAGELRSVLFGYACHATTVSFNQWSGDYPGYAQIELENAHPGCVALFWAGCGADQNPLPRRTVELAEKYGAELARAVDAVLDSPMPPLKPDLTTSYREIALKLQQIPDVAALAKTEKSTNRFEVARARVLQQQLKEKGAIRSDYLYPISLWNLGNEVEFIHLGGEVVIDYALRIKKERRGRKTWVAGYSHDVMAYIPSLRVLREGGYEGGGSNVYYGLPGLWDESIERDIVKAITELATQ